MGRLPWIRMALTLTLALALFVSPSWAQEVAPPQQPVAIDPPPMQTAVDGRIMVPNWLERPTARDFARYYPRQAHDQHISGRAELDCVVATYGHLSCTVLSETPEGYAFGDAALRLARQYRMAPALADDTPTDGKRVSVTLRFEPDA